MNPLQQVKFVKVVPPAAIVDDAAVTCEVVDTLGWDYATIVAFLGATDIAATAFNVTESDDNSNFTMIAATNFANTSLTDMDGTALALPTATDDNKFFVVHCDMRRHKRYLQLAATAGNGSAGTYITAFAVLSRGEIKPNSSSEQGAKNVVVV